MEDYHLSIAFAGKEHGIYIDIGGGHPIAGSVSFWFYERGWQGLVVEPQEKLALLHRRLRPRDTFVQAVVGHDAAEVEFYEIDRLHGLSTTVKRYAEAAAAHQASYRALRVPSLSLAELCARHAPSGIDFLKIDVEGAEYDVIRGGDWQRYRPAVVVVEAITPDTNEPSWNAWETILLGQGYGLALFDSLNRFYVADECSDILARFPKSRAPWERVVHMYEIGRALDNAVHPEHQLARQLAHAFLASLPHLTDDTIKALLASNDGTSANVDKTASIDTEAFRLALGRIACGYDGGQLHEEASQRP
jgi:FkbM family methyltransferase